MNKVVILLIGLLGFSQLSYAEVTPYVSIGVVQNNIDSINDVTGLTFTRDGSGYRAGFGVSFPLGEGGFSLEVEGFYASYGKTKISGTPSSEVITGTGNALAEADNIAVEFSGVGALVRSRLSFSHQFSISFGLGYQTLTQTETHDGVDATTGANLFGSGSKLVDGNPGALLYELSMAYSISRNVLLDLVWVSFSADRKTNSGISVSAKIIF